ncbi:MAG TPA: GNAT family N-acetyltransferase [Acidimicrobiales bacterium]|nr:GNAT family N-acetyltransferase [Acidimicrobiales bacterium]
MKTPIEEATSASADVVEALGRLIPQLSRSSPPPSLEQVEAIVRSEASTLLVARDEDGSILGTLTLAMFRIPTGVRAWIEDVVTDEAARGRGVAADLTEEAIRRARAAGAKTVELTSRPSREAANRLYLRLGFQLRETNVYRYELD